MPEIKLSNRELLVMNYVTSAIGNVLSHKELLEKIGIPRIVRNFPRECWQIFQEAFSDISVAPTWSETEWEDEPEAGDKELSFLVGMAEAGLSAEYAIISYERLFNAVTPEALVKNFRGSIWDALTEALADEGEGDGDEDDEEPEVEEEENGQKGTRTPTLPGTPGGGNGD